MSGMCRRELAWSVVLLHQRGGRPPDWTPLCKSAAKGGVYGARPSISAARVCSIQEPGPTGNEAPWQTSGDIAAAVRVAERERRYRTGRRVVWSQQRLDLRSGTPEFR